MGRAPCCDKANVKKGPWSPEEDSKLKSYIENHGIGGNWIALPQKIGLKRCGKSCRLRWLNYLRPNLKHGGFSEEEDNIICTLYRTIGSRWSIIAAQLPGRTDNDIKNYWNTRLKKKLLGKQRKEQQARRATTFVKQEMKIHDQIDHHHHHSYFMSNPDQTVNLIYPYWPELPVATSVVQNPAPDPHHDIKNLLVKLGGRFSATDQQQQQQQIVTSDFQNPCDQLYENSNNSMMNNNLSELVNGGGMSYDYPEFNNDEVFCGIAEQLGGGLIIESSCGDGYDHRDHDHHQMGINGSSTTSTSTESSYSNWAGLNSLVCAPNLLDHPMYSNYEQDCAQEMMMLQSYAFDALQ